MTRTTPALTYRRKQRKPERKRNNTLVELSDPSRQLTSSAAWLSDRAPEGLERHTQGRAGHTTELRVVVCTSNQNTAKIKGLTPESSQGSSDSPHSRPPAPPSSSSGCGRLPGPLETSHGLCERRPWAAGNKSQCTPGAAGGGKRARRLLADKSHRSQGLRSHPLFTSSTATTGRFPDDGGATTAVPGACAAPPFPASVPGITSGLVGLPAAC